LVAAPLYFSGKVTFGGLMMAAGAFSQAQSSLRWFIDNFSAIADWRAHLMRVANFRYAVMSVHEPSGFTSSISYAEGASGSISIEGLEIVSSAHSDRLEEERVVIKSGERVLILGAPGTGKTQLFRALAGLWPWGQGRIVRPAGEHIFYLPRGTPYMPRGTLREVLAYPQKADNFPDAAFKRALFRLGLERLAPLLDSTQRWDRELSQDEQLSLAVARILLQSPPWMLVDGTFGQLDDDVLAVLLDIFRNELKETAIIHIGGPAQAHSMFTRTLHLVKAERRSAAALAEATPGNHA
jgi:putative ATP-binding cassette transporter